MTGTRPARALVVGGRGGIGSAVVTALSSGVATVDTADLAVGPPVGVPGARHDVVDIADDAAREAWLEGYLAECGVPDGIAWCAGIYPRRDIREYPLQQIRRVIDVNLVSLVASLPHLIGAALDAGHPMRIAVVGSQAAVTGGRDVPYAAAKAGCVAAVKSIAREYAASGITINVVSPGPVDTAMAAVMGEQRRAYYESAIPIGRFSQPQEVASTVRWLLLEAPAAICGTVIDVDGALVRR